MITHRGVSTHCSDWLAGRHHANDKYGRGGVDLPGLPMVHVFIGIAGAGKSTRARKLGLPVLSSDALRAQLNLGPVDSSVFTIMETQAREHVMAGKDVVIDATNLTREYRRQWLNIGPARHAAWVCIAPLELALARNAARERHVPEQAICRHFRQLVVPIPGEGWDEIHLVRTDGHRWLPLNSAAELYEHWARQLLDEWVECREPGPRRPAKLGKHLVRVGRLLQALSPWVGLAGLFHELGRPLIGLLQQEDDSAPEDHCIETVSAHLALLELTSFDVPDERVLGVAQLIAAQALQPSAQRDRLLAELGGDHERLEALFAPRAANEQAM